MRFRIRVGGQVVVVDGARVGAPDATVDVTAEVDDGVVLPGLVNAHDHLHRNHYPRLGEPPYRDVYAWGDDLHRRYSAELERARGLPRRDALLVGALKNILGGATTVVHHDPWEDDFAGDFPVRVPPLRHVHTLRLDPGGAARAAAPRDDAPDHRGRVTETGAAAGASRGPLLLHLAEGVGEAAADEVREAERLGLLTPDLVAVHCVGVDEAGVGLLRRAGAAVVWCPTSNRFLYGSGPSRELLRSGVDVLLGTDALVSGDGTLLDELRAAMAAGHLDAASLLEAVGARAARRLGLPSPSLETGAPADLVVLRRPLLQALPADVALVVTDGRVRLADDAFVVVMDAMGTPREPVRLQGRVMWVEAPMARALRHARDLLPEVLPFVD